MEKQQNRKIFAMLLAFIGVILFSTKAIMVKMAYQYNIDPLSLLFIRMILVFPVYIIIAIITEWRASKSEKLNLKQAIALIFLGSCGYYFSSLLDFMGLKYITASLERLILFIYPTLVVFISAIVDRKTIPGRQLLAIGISYFGIFMVFNQDVGFHQQHQKWLGPILILLCALAYAIYLVGSGKLIPKIGSMRFTSYAMIASTLGILVHTFFNGHIKIIGYPIEVYHLGVELAVVATLLPSFIISEAIRRLGSPTVAIIASIGPISTIFLATLFLGEKLNVFQWIGAMIVVSGVLLVSTEKPKPLGKELKNIIA